MRPARANRSSAGVGSEAIRSWCRRVGIGLLCLVCLAAAAVVAVSAGGATATTATVAPSARNRAPAGAALLA
ncbi:MAG TPA: hypothetical protein VED63_11945, partial [Acidimicrobiales bacterium]|nr:hypothetical protein [Acidimicrobiales bacterium]